MPEQVTTIQLDSNIMREPHRLTSHFGVLAGGIALDLILWFAWNGSRHVVMHVPHFCKMFGYNRAHILRPLPEAYLNRMRKVVKEEHLENFNSTLGWALIMMLKGKITFYANEEEKLKDVSAKMKECRISSLSILDDISFATGIKKKKTGTMVTLVVSERLMKNCNGEFFQQVKLEDYLSLKTPKGHPDDKARRLYLHMTWKRQTWDWAQIQRGVHPSLVLYDDLKAVLLLTHDRESKNANLMRDYLKRVCALPSVKMGYTVELGGPAGTYQVHLTKSSKPLRKLKKARKQESSVNEEVN